MAAHAQDTFDKLHFEQVLKLDMSTILAGRVCNFRTKIQLATFITYGQIHVENASDLNDILQIR